MLHNGLPSKANFKGLNIVATEELVPWVPSYRFSIWLLVAVLVISMFCPVLVQWGLYLIWAVYAAVAHCAPLRQSWLTKPLMAWFKSVLPVVSDTEQTAIDAGDVWWEAQLMRGSPKWQQLHQWPLPKFTPEEAEFFATKIPTLCGLIDDWQITHEACNLSPAVWRYLKEAGFLGMIIPKQYGGLGFSAYFHSEVITTLATHSTSVAITTMVPNSLGPAELLLHYGTDAQKEYYLPRLAKGIEVPCFALTGPEAGSDAGAMPDTGVVIRLPGNENALGIRLNWDKRYITLAPVATLLGLAVKLYDPEKLLGGEIERGITLCLIPTNLPGIEIGARHLPLDSAFLNGPTRGKDVIVNLDTIIGGASCIGQGWRMLMECLSAGRGISLPALSAGCGAVCLLGSSAYSAVRKQFKTPIAQFEGVALKLARIAGIQYLLEATRHLTVIAVDQGYKPSVVSAISKYHMTEWARVALNDAMDIHAGRGIILGPNNYLGRLYQSMPISITVEGANILTRNLIIFGQGAIRCHPYVLSEIAATAMSDGKAGLKAFDAAFFSHLGYTLKNIGRSILLGWTRGKTAKVPHDVILKNYYQKVAWMSALMSVLTDVAMLLLGGSLKRREALSARLGDILSNLYLITAMLHHFYHRQQGEAERPYVEWMAQYLFAEIGQALEALYHNFPYLGVVRFIKWICLPFGTGFTRPSDALSLQLAASLSEDSAIQKSLTHACAPGGKLLPALAIVEEARKAARENEPLEQKLQRAVKEGKLAKSPLWTETLAKAIQTGILTVAEFEALQKTEEMRKLAVRVDEFDPNSLGINTHDTA